jgi:hypothetical protein
MRLKNVLRVANIDGPRSHLVNFLDLIEHGAKIFALFIGTIYITGYIVTTTRLAQYDVPAIRLLDAQYFVAGAVPGLLVWLTIVVAASAFLGSDKQLIWVAVTIFVLFLAAMVMEVVKGHSSNTILNAAYVALKIVLGQLALWFLIVGVRTRYLFRMRDYLKATRDDAGGLLISVVVSVVLVIIALKTIPQVGWSAYNRLPQAYGGGKPLQIELIVDGNKAPCELLVITDCKNRQPVERTVPLNLILKTSAEYVVISPADQKRRAWVLKADVVRAELIGGSLQ